MTSSTILRLKRSLAENPEDTLVLLCKQNRTDKEEISHSLFVFRGTVDDQEPAHIKILPKTDLEQQSVPKVDTIIEKWRTARKQVASKSRYELVNCIRGLKDAGTENVLNLIDLQKTKDKDCDVQYVYDLYTPSKQEFDISMIDNFVGAVLESPLAQVRASRRLAQRRVNALPAEARQELKEKKRESKQQAQLERMLMPGAPPRKRATRRPSPERHPCILNDPFSLPVAEDMPSTSRLSPSPEHLQDLRVAEGMPSTSRMSGSPEHLLDLPVVLAEELPAIVENVEFVYCDEAGAATGSNSTGVSEIGVTETIQDWIDLADLSDDNDNDVCPLALAPITTDPACVSDLSVFQAKVLQREDAANDAAIRDLVPEDCFTFNWSNDRGTFLGRRETFTGSPGPTFVVTDQTRPVDIYDKMFTGDFLDLLVTETNRYAEQRIGLLREQNQLKPFSRLNRWVPTNRDEMATFLAIKILQGLYPLPDEESYFTFNGFGTLTYFPRIMSYNRFVLLKSFLHFVDTNTTEDMTRLGKIRPVLDYLNDRFSSLYMPSQEIAIDESLLKWHGRLSFAQKIASKAAQVGVKTYELCESSSGYLWKFFVYTGKAQPTTTTAENSAGRPEPMTMDDDDTNDGQDDDDEPTDRTTVGSGDRPTNATAKIVYDLVEPLLHRGHTLIMDNFYNSPLLCRSLKRQSTDCYGTLRLNREFVPESVKTLNKSELRHGEVVATYCSDLSVLVWRDANLVSMISTYHDLQIGTQDKNNRLTYKPSIVLDYNKNMGGIDKKDQFLSAQPIERVRNKVWYKKLFRRLYSAAIFNCFVIFSSVQRKISHRQFRTVLADELMKRHRQIDLTTEVRRLNYRSSTSGQVVTMPRRPRHKTQARAIVEHNHFPIPTGTKNTVCRQCTKKTRTSWKCEECDVPLCIRQCFKDYHK